jgi:3-oxoacid CoA-transferase subunit A
VAAIAIGGAYSVDKYHRLVMDWHWWSDEQQDEQTKGILKSNWEARE